MKEFLNTTSIFFIMLLLEHFIEPPISEPFCNQHFSSIRFRSLYRGVIQCQCHHMHSKETCAPEISY